MLKGLIFSARRDLKLRWKRYGLPLLWAGFLYLSCKDAFKVYLLASVFYPQHLLPGLNSSEQILSRDIQAYFLRSGIYIPVEDILVRSDRNQQDTKVKLLEQSCGQGNLYIWLPLQFRFPLIGEKVLEWCLVKTSA